MPPKAISIYTSPSASARLLTLLDNNKTLTRGGPSSRSSRRGRIGRSRTSTPRSGASRGLVPSAGALNTRLPRLALVYPKLDESSY